MFPRVAKRVRPDPERPVHVQIMGEGFIDVFAARDISVTGVSVVVPHRFAGCRIDDELDLVVTLPGERPFLTKGRIVHRTKTSYEFFGVSFVRLSKPHRRRIAAYVDGQR